MSTYRPSAPQISSVVRRNLLHQFQIALAVDQFMRLNKFNISSFPPDLKKIIKKFNKNVRASGNARTAAGAAAAYKRALEAAPQIQRILNRRAKAIANVKLVIGPNGHIGHVVIPNMPRSPPARTAFQSPARRRRS